ncbi:hypothetical protein IE077_000156 [Cardiosporidium cionae]|uniref:ELM2 domain-containing protein n=1 Tax=Cardiosporidium cionae TaxID=476202 RepID=A0ABQ7JE20_9APIC|nr:hypothetical protein IE077_000156 [Cardiosporidium cionae]|eukprot:KAF8821890.1 hypothetical protein IE077_000156 [Cardiosporidium cionae]
MSFGYDKEIDLPLGVQNYPSSSPSSRITGAISIVKVISAPLDCTESLLNQKNVGMELHFETTSLHATESLSGKIFLAADRSSEPDLPNESVYVPSENPRQASVSPTATRTFSARVSSKALDRIGQMDHPRSLLLEATQKKPKIIVSAGDLPEPCTSLLAKESEMNFSWKDIGDSRQLRSEPLAIDHAEQMDERIMAISSNHLSIEDTGNQLDEKNVSSSTPNTVETIFDPGNEEFLKKLESFVRRCKPMADEKSVSNFWDLPFTGRVPSSSSLNESATLPDSRSMSFPSSFPSQLQEETKAIEQNSISKVTRPDTTLRDSSENNPLGRGSNPFAPSSLPIETTADDQAFLGQGKDILPPIGIESINLFVATMQERMQIENISEEGPLQRSRSPDGKWTLKRPCSDYQGMDLPKKSELPSLDPLSRERLEGNTHPRDGPPPSAASAVISVCKTPGIPPISDESDKSTCVDEDSAKKKLASSQRFYEGECSSTHVLNGSQSIQEYSHSHSEKSFSSTNWTLPKPSRSDKGREESPPNRWKGRSKAPSVSRSNSPFPEEREIQGTLTRARGRQRLQGEEMAARIKVGPTFQVPSIPLFFLDTNMVDYSRRGRSYFDSPKLVYSPELLQQNTLKRMNAGHSCRCIQNDIDCMFDNGEEWEGYRASQSFAIVNLFLKRCAQRWKIGPGWQPFSPEFAYKLLHKAEYDPEEALCMLSHPAFDFSSICDPPTRKYDNKWRPKDRRGQHPCCPYPPPFLSKGTYICRKTNTNAS